MSVVLAAPAPTAVVIEAIDLEHRFAPGRGLARLSFAITGPGAVAIVGANGSGKSTLLRILAGLLRPSGGSATVTVDGHSVPRASRRACVGYAAPELMFYDELSVLENLRFAAEAMGLRGGDAAADALECVGLGRRADDRVSVLSSGMKQRLRLAFAVLSRPAVLLLDEPGSHLDDEGRRLVTELVERQQGHGMAVIATNDEREWKLAERRIELCGRGLGGPA